MYYVDVYEDDRMTVAGRKRFFNKESCKQFATLNQPCVVFTNVHTNTGFVYLQEIARYGMEDEE